MVYRRGDPSVAGGAANPARRAAALLCPCDHHGPDDGHGVWLGTAADRGADRLRHWTAWARPRGTGPFHLEPPGQNAGAAAAAESRNRPAPFAGGQHWPEARWRRRMADRKARNVPPPILAEVAYRCRRRQRRDRRRR